MANDILLKIEGLRASVEDKEILKGVDLVIRKGEIHAVMGPNGAGKSTLSAVLAGKPQFTVTAGSIEFLGQDLLAMSPEERAWAGIFLSFQYPVEIPGVTITNFMKTAVNAHRAGKGLIVYKPTPVTGDVASGTLVSDEDSILIMSNTTSICISATEIPMQSRVSMGNQLIKATDVTTVSKV